MTPIAGIFLILTISAVAILIATRQPKPAKVKACDICGGETRGTGSEQFCERCGDPIGPGVQ